MEKLKNDVLIKWLNIDLINIGTKSKLISKKIEIEDSLIYDSIRCLDYETIVNPKPNINYIITVVALMWEYIDHTRFDLKSAVIKFLSRVGYPTSAIIADNNFNKNYCSFGNINSTIDKITIALKQAENEVFVKGKKYLLTDYQKHIWDSLNSKSTKVIGISAPTSAGKSFVLLLKMVDLLCKRNIDIVYIVPTLSLLTQVTEDFNKELKNVNAKNYYISNSYEKGINEKYNHIYVLTQEKAIASFADNDNPFDKPLILIVDEIQNIERIQDPLDQRAKILFDTLMEFRDKQNVKKVILSGPRIEDIGYCGKKIFGVETNELTTVISPVLNLTYSIEKRNNKYYFKQYCALCSRPLEISITNDKIIKGYGNKQYNNSYLKFFNIFYKNIGANDQNIIFSPTSTTARKIACNIDGCISENDTKDLIDYYQETIHKNYTMCETLLKGVAYHHGKLPMHVRRTIEYAIINKKVKTVVCTTTLMQGVNLPAQNIFIRNPHLYINKRTGSSELSNYEMANLRGRAGRLLKDFTGRTFVIDESGFVETDGYEQTSLFDNPTKELPTGFEERFDEYETAIIDIANSTNTVDNSMQSYGYLISLIRQSILRYGDESVQRMNHIGIKLSKEQVAAIKLKLDSLSVPKSICLKNRYWDPFVLDDIYKNFSLDVPDTPKQKGAKNKLSLMLKYLRDNKVTSYMYEKNIPERYRKGRSRSLLCDLSIKWANQIPLNIILSNIKDGNADKIEDTIELLQNTISFNIPLLLKPIFDINKPDSVFLTCMQSGAFNIIIRNMIEMGIPRETAIYLFTTIFHDVKSRSNDKEEIKQLIREKLIENIDKLPELIQIQVKYLI